MPPKLWTWCFTCGDHRLGANWQALGPFWNSKFPSSTDRLPWHLPEICFLLFHTWAPECSRSCRQVASLVHDQDRLGALLSLFVVKEGHGEGVTEKERRGNNLGTWLVVPPHARSAGLGTVRSMRAPRNLLFC